MDGDGKVVDVVDAASVVLVVGVVDDAATTVAGATVEAVGAVGAIVVGGLAEAVDRATVAGTSLGGKFATFALLEHAPSRHSDTIIRPVRLHTLRDRSASFDVVLTVDRVTPPPPQRLRVAEW